MTDLFQITPTPPTTLSVRTGKPERFSFTVKSLAAPDQAHDVVLQALRVGADGKGEEVDWLAVGPPRTLHLAGGKTETVVITAQPTARTAPGTYTIKLVIADQDRPNDVYAEAPTVACEVVKVDPPPRPFPWWWLAIAGGVVVLAGVGVLIWRLASRPSGPPGLGEACASDPRAACDEGLVCEPGSGRCLLAAGATCRPAEAAQCLSGECASALELCTAPIGGACQPGEKDVAPCHTGSVCDPATKRCLGTVGAPCRAAGDCETGTCKAGACATATPAVQPGDPCAGTCPAPLQCSATTRRCVEQLGRPCSRHNQCASGLCEASVCTRPTVLRNCTADGICDADQQCLDVQPGLKRCRWRPGHACTTGAECTSRLGCNRGVCARDDGRCEQQADCPAPYTCVSAKHTCLILDGNACSTDAECDGGFCQANRCASSRCPMPCVRPLVCNNDKAAPRCVPRFLSNEVGRRAHLGGPFGP